jgi:putative ABC transport system permease protein
MTRHLLKLVWNRKRQHLLLAVEVFLSFLVLFVVAATTVTNYYNWRQPLGFTIERAWMIRVLAPPVAPGSDTAGGELDRARERFAHVRQVLDDLPAVERSALSVFSSPYQEGGWSSNLGPNRVGASLHVVSDEFADLFGIRLTAGRWFSAEDDAGTTQPVVLNTRLARQLFGDADPLGRELTSPRPDAQAPLRVIGIIDEFRHEGELSLPGNVAMLRLTDGGAVADRLPELIAIRVAPGTTADFEESLVDTLQAAAPDWSFQIEPLETRRTAVLREAALPLVVAGIVAGFLLLMVALGMTGVVWQNVASRIQEFGLRRANGATASSVQRQVMTELALLATLPLAVGVALVAQIPVLPVSVFGLIPAGVWISSIAVSVAVIYVLTLLCAWYPSRLATRIQPADALHYE